MQKYLYRRHEGRFDDGPEYWATSSEGHGYWTSSRESADRYTSEHIDDVNIHNWPPDDGAWHGEFIRDGIDVSLVGDIDPVYVAVYDVNRVCGGPEEGGWWFDTGDLIKVVICPTEFEAERVREDLRNEFPYTRKRYSVLGGEDYDIEIVFHTFPADHFPTEYPHYE